MKHTCIVITIPYGLIAYTLMLAVGSFFFLISQINLTISFTFYRIIFSLITIFKKLFYFLFPSMFGFQIFSFKKQKINFINKCVGYLLLCQGAVH